MLFQFPEVVPLNVGGMYFTTRLSTLRRCEDTMLAAMFSGRHYIPTDAQGRYFIDRDGTYFGYVHCPYYSNFETVTVLGIINFKKGKNSFAVF